METTEISRTDNLTLASAAREMATAMRTLTEMLPGSSPALERLVLKFAGEPLPEEMVDQVTAAPPR